jgi:hypothetical protein
MQSDTINGGSGGGEIKGMVRAGHNAVGSFDGSNYIIFRSWMPWIKETQINY